MTLSWQGSMKDQKVTFERLTLWVHWLAKGRWLWALTEQMKMISPSGKVKTEYKKVASGECRCRKAAVHEVVYRGWEKGLVLAGRHRCGNRTINT